MASHRFEIDTSAGPAREGVLYGRSMCWSASGCSTGPASLTSSPASPPQMRTSIPTCVREARRLVFGLLECAEHAEQVTEQAGWWQVQR